MEREIKFRALTIPYEEKDFKYESEWLYGYVHQDHNGNFFIIENHKTGRVYPGISVIPETVGQFTGLKDKNGKEIYEGDIVIAANGKKHDIRFGEFEFGNDDSIDSCIGFSFSGNEPFSSCSAGAGSMYEIIGNIHQNPSLL